MKLFKLSQYLKFLLTSTNQHGVHSPFIYKYVTRCLYAKPNYTYSHAINIFLKNIAYFNLERLWLSDEHEQIKNIIKQEFPFVHFDTESFDALFMNAKEIENLLTILATTNRIRNDSVLLMTGIHEKRSSLSTWEKLKDHKKVTVTVDMFYCGAVFFRKEQAKEHFKIRI